MKLKIRDKIERSIRLYGPQTEIGFIAIGLVIGSLLAIPISFGIVWLINLIPGA